MNRRLLVTLIAIALPAVAAPAAFSPAAAQIDFRIDMAPPAPRAEMMPAPNPGHVWAPGHWRWDGRQHVWFAGRWEPVRPGFRHVPEHWERFVDNGRERWRFNASRWDRDGDGIPNRVDPRDNRVRHIDRDRDGIPDVVDPRDNRVDPRRARGDRDRDGIPNRVDNHDNRRGPFGDRDRDGVPNLLDNSNRR